MALALIALALLVWRWAAGEGVHKFSPRHLLGGVAGIVAILFAAISLAHLAGAFERIPFFAVNGVTFHAPVQQASSALTVEVANLPANTPTFGFVKPLLLGLFALAVWLYGWARDEKFLPRILGWTLLAWAALCLPNGVPAFLAVVAAFVVLHAVIPSLKQLWRVPAKTDADFPPPPAEMPPVVTPLLPRFAFVRRR